MVHTGQWVARHIGHYLHRLRGDYHLQGNFVIRHIAQGLVGWLGQSGLVQVVYGLRYTWVISVCGLVIGRRLVAQV